ncbi:MAG: hypothetical protein UV73_C0010G0060 [Candidatus Gottesmanbacteria bacterium GW2011_GWA2_43_14]|uniref:Uncharacterized protein n=1 Tax=Candidatus Gottesmanbacteria bacterium GW2011_GWA2_43_14 TaxID=1618443 RepID=A0A0G1DEY8_9BACT|nr:MAG: hypothetical protein UV73_C0010G0060 [Candidatus Gottesmanbacteria bacterium GW2011_GWA2_43_14]
MKNKALLAVLVTVLIGGAAVYFAFSNRSNPAGGSQSEIQTGQSVTETGSTQKSLKELFLSGVSQECSFSDENGSEGSVRVAQGKSRGDFSAVAGGKKMQSHMIVDGQTSYMWLDGQTTGFKMSIDSTAQADNGQTQGNVDVNKKVDFRCQPWRTDNSVFNLPAGINFTDLGDFQPPITNAEGAVNTRNQQCAACNYLQGEAKSQCLVSLNCN